MEEFCFYPIGNGKLFNSFKQKDVTKWRDHFVCNKEPWQEEVVQVDGEAPVSQQLQIQAENNDYF